MIRVFVQDMISVFSPVSIFPGLEALPFQAINRAWLMKGLCSSLLNRYETVQQEKYVAHSSILQIKEGRERKEPLCIENKPVL